MDGYFDGNIRSKSSAINQSDRKAQISAKIQRGPINERTKIQTASGCFRKTATIVGKKASPITTQAASTKMIGGATCSIITILHIYSKKSTTIVVLISVEVMSTDVKYNRSIT